MIQGIFSFIKYPSASAIIGVIWVGMAILVISDQSLPILKMVFINMVASFFIGYIGFRVDKT
jgi:hypothetical protein